MAFSKRPELVAPPQFFYDDSEARKYSENSRIIGIQMEMAERAIELLNLEEGPHLILDIGCGSGLSGQALEEAGHQWIGIDISKAMLDVAKEREVEGDVILSDMGDGVPFKPGFFDGAISVSALQWLCNADTSTQKPVQRLYQFFTSLYASLDSGARAIFQFYPANQDQTDLIMAQAKRAGFDGGLVIDYPESTKARKYYLALVAGLPKNGDYTFPDAKTNAVEDGPSISYSHRATSSHKGRNCNVKSVKQWIQSKKERRRRQGRDARPDSKYTGRKRSSKF